MPILSSRGAASVRGFGRGFSPPLATIVTTGLILNLDAGNIASYPGSGTTWTDLSGNGNNGTLVNGPTYSSESGGKITFNGTNNYVNMGDKFNIDEGTIDFWFKPNVTINPTTAASPANYRPFGKTDSFEARFNNVLQGLGGYGIFGADFGQPTASLISTQNTWTNGVWYNMVFSWKVSTNNSQFYVQSVLDSTGTSATLAGNSGNFAIAASRGGASGFVPMDLATFRIYNIQLSSTQITQNFNVLKGRFGY
jgi:hypothetical protein